MADPTAASPCPDCGATFKLREASGPCPKCEKLRDVDRHSSSFDQLSEWPQCTLCGVTFEFMRKTVPQVCPSVKCIGASNPPSSQTQISQAANQPTVHHMVFSEAQDARTEAVRHRMHLSAPGQPGTAHTTESLRQHQLQTFGGPGSANTGVRMIRLIWDVRQSSNKSKIPNTSLGSKTQAHPASSFLLDLLKGFHGPMADVWSKAYSTKPLPLDSLSWRWFPASTAASATPPLIEPHTLAMTLGDFYDFYKSNNQDSACIDGRNTPAHYKTIQKASKHNPTVFLILFVAVEFALDLIKDPGQPESSVNSSMRTKRPRQHSESEIEPPATRRANSGRSGRSAFPSSQFSGLQSNQPHLLTAASATDVTAMEFSKLLCIIGSDDQISTMRVKDTITGLLADAHFAHGKMKVAFDLHINGKEDEGHYAAKRFFRLSDKDKCTPTSTIKPDDVVSYNEAIILEATRMSRASQVLKEFYKYATDNPDIKIEKGIQFSKMFLLVEKGNNMPSVASARESSIYGDDEGPIWLIEPKRAMSVTKFTGTLDQASRLSDNLAQTVYSFIHFSYLFSRGQYVFADLQGTPSHENGKAITVLFDVMTHTIDGNSGIGDFGDEGIKAFLDTHKCGDICEGLKIKGKSVKDLLKGGDDLDDEDSVDQLDDD